MRDLIALALPPGMPFVVAMQRAWDDGDAILPVDPRLPAPARARLLASLRPTLLLDEQGDVHRLPDGVPVEEGDAFVIATSGSTGDPKGVIHTHDSARASAHATAAFLEVDPDRDGWLCCLPLSHIAGLSVVLRALASGTRLEVLPAFDARTVEAAARERGATLTTLVPTALARIDPMLFRRIVVGGAAPPKHLPPNAVVSYGMTETGSAITYDGQALGSAEFRVADGEILLRGPQLLRAYRGGGYPLDGHDPKDAEGWFATDDAGEIDRDGRLVVHGRRGDLIVTGGEKVWPTEVERVLALHPGVAEVAVIGRPDPEWGHRVTALVVPTEPATPPTLDELRAHTKAELPSYAAPRELDLLPALPRTLLGKVERKALTEGGSPERSRPSAT